MTEGDRAFYKRRIREELTKASAAKDEQLKRLHLRWALLYQERLDGAPKHVIGSLDAKLREAGYAGEPLPRAETPLSESHAAGPGKPGWRAKMLRP